MRRSLFTIACIFCLSLLGRTKEQILSFDYSTYAEREYGMRIRPIRGFKQLFGEELGDITWLCNDSLCVYGQGHSIVLMSNDKNCILLFPVFGISRSGPSIEPSYDVKTLKIQISSFVRNRIASEILCNKLSDPSAHFVDDKQINPMFQEMKGNSLYVSAGMGMIDSIYTYILPESGKVRLLLLNNHTTQSHQYFTRNQDSRDWTIKPKYVFAGGVVLTNSTSPVCNIFHTHMFLTQQGLENKDRFVNDLVASMTRSVNSDAERKYYKANYHSTMQLFVPVCNVIDKADFTQLKDYSTVCVEEAPLDTYGFSVILRSADRHCLVLLPEVPLYRDSYNTSDSISNAEVVGYKHSLLKQPKKKTFSNRYMYSIDKSIESIGYNLHIMFLFDDKGIKRYNQYMEAFYKYYPT